MPKCIVKKAKKKSGSRKKKLPEPPQKLWKVKSCVMEDIDHLMRANVKTLKELIQGIKEVRENAPNRKKTNRCILAYRDMLCEYREKVKPFIDIIDTRE